MKILNLKIEVEPVFERGTGKQIPLKYFNEYKNKYGTVLAYPERTDPFYTKGQYKEVTNSYFIIGNFKIIEVLDDAVICDLYIEKDKEHLLNSKTTEFKITGYSFKDSDGWGMAPEYAYFTYETAHHTAADCSAYILH